MNKLPDELHADLAITDSGPMTRAMHLDPSPRAAEAIFSAAGSGPRSLLLPAKRVFDIAMALAVTPLILAASVLLLLLNPFWNRGPLFYLQRRMGKDCRPFTAIKFRTMTPAATIARGPDDPVEDERITTLGRVLRRSRIDELPQFFNVLVGDMSVIGPRPDFWDHAVHYFHTVPGYRYRHAVRPGITGLAQVDGGYAEGMTATFEKTRFDMRYITGFGLTMECYILWRTLCVILTGFGAR